MTYSLTEFICGQVTCPTEASMLELLSIVLALPLLAVIIYGIVCSGTEPKPPSEVGK